MEVHDYALKWFQFVAILSVFDGPPHIIDFASQDICSFPIPVLTSHLALCRRSNYLRFGLDQKALATIEARKRKVGAVLESKGRVLFLTDSEGRLSLPAHATLGEEGKDAAGLIGLLQSISVQSEIEFLFAVYEDTRGGFNVYYRGSLVGDSVPDPARARLIAFDEIPWDELPDDAMRAMLRRYISEREEDLFGVYVGDTKSGDVRRLGTR